MSSSRKVLRSQENVTKHGPHIVAVTSTGGKIRAHNGAPPPAAAAIELAPPPPKAPRSAFMCFTDVKKSEIMARHGIREEKLLLKLVAKEWRALSSNDRAYWDEVAREDKVRFVREKAEYKGPWTVPKRRAKKHPLAPKRPMSAFLKYSQKRRSMVKQDNPDMSNTDVSRLLGEMWRNASAKEKEQYVQQEVKERAVYKEKIKSFKDEQAKKDAASRTSHKSVQKMAKEFPQLPPRPTYEDTLSSTFESSLRGGGTVRGGTVEDATQKADQRVMFRHNFGTPLPPYRASYDAHAQAQAQAQAHHHHHHHHPGSHSGGHHHRAPEYSYSSAPAPEPLPPLPLPPAHRPSHHLEEEDEFLYPGNYASYFSDTNSFNFYNNGGYP